MEPKVNSVSGLNEYGWPSTVVMLEPSDFIGGEWRKENGQTKHCFEGWVSALFDPNDPEGRTTASNHEAAVFRCLFIEEFDKIGDVSQRQRLASHIDDKVGVGVGLATKDGYFKYGLEGVNDNLSGNYENMCKAFNAALKRLGYGTVVDSNPVVV